MAKALPKTTAAGAAGFLAGLVNVGVLGAISITLLIALKTDATTALAGHWQIPYGTDAIANYDWAVSVGFAIPMIPLAILGGVMGIFYAYFHTYIPIKQPMVKGLIFSILFVYIEIIVASLGRAYGATFHAIMVTASAIMALFYGLMLGLLYERISIKTEVIEK